MDSIGIDLPETDAVDDQIVALDQTIKVAESILEDADENIDKLIQKRGKLASRIQNLWIRRYHLNQALTKKRESQDPFYSGNRR